jgi:hypothetical protein
MPQHNAPTVNHMISKLMVYSCVRTKCPSIPDFPRGLRELMAPRGGPSHVYPCD